MLLVKSVTDSRCTSNGDDTYTCIITNATQTSRPNAGCGCAYVTLYETKGGNKTGSTYPNIVYSAVEYQVRSSLAVCKRARIN